MRILLVMNMYPPHSDGGYPLECFEVVEALRARGHEILVVTSNKGLEGRRTMEANIWRVFEYCPDNKSNAPRSLAALDLFRWYRREWIEHGFLKKALAIFKPDVIYVWATKGLSHSLAVHLAHIGLPFLAHVSGYWLVDHNKCACHRSHYEFWNWGETRGISAVAKKIVCKVLQLRIPVIYEPLVFDRIAFTSRAIQSQHDGIPTSQSAPVRIYPGVPVERFAVLPAPSLAHPRRILFIGRLHPSKDPLTLIRACAILQAEVGLNDMELSLMGWVHDQNYLEELRAAIAAAPRPESVHILSPVPFNEMPKVFSAHHILVLPSMHEPFGRVAAEAMAAGLAIIVSDRTGIGELLLDGVSGLIFPAGRTDILANLLRQLMTVPALADKLSEYGRSLSLEYFSTKRMVDEIETFLKEGLENFHGTSDAEQSPAERRANA